MLISSEKQLLINLNKIQIFYIDKFIKDLFIKYHEIQYCILCNGSDNEFIAEKDQYGIPCPTVRCRDCGLIFSKKQLTNESMIRFYDKYYRRIYEGVDGVDMTHQFYQKLYDGWVSKVPKFIKKNSYVVEFGCGGGWNLLPFLRKGIKHAGYDYDSKMIDYGKKKYGLNLFYGGLEEVTSNCKSVDYFILSQVVEHLSDPVYFLNKIRSCFSHNGLICITVPSLNYMEYFGGNSTHFDIELNLQNAHNFTFDECTLNALLCKAGYEPILILGGYAIARAFPENISKLNKTKTKCIDFKSLVKIKKSTKLKYLINKKIPKLLYNFFMLRSFYFFNPVKSLRYLIINRLGFWL